MTSGMIGLHSIPTSDDQIEKYLNIATKSVKGVLIIGAFSHDGPAKCSGLTIMQYNEEELQQQLLEGFSKIKCFTENHQTPFETKQNYLFCSSSKNY